MSTTAPFTRGFPRKARAGRARPAVVARGTLRGWVTWLWKQLVEIGEARTRARMARGHWR
jgi:hypothetical protein